MTNKLYLEIAKDSGAVLSFSYEKLVSKTSGFIEVNEAELNYLNLLESNVLPKGQVTTLSDLQDYRAKTRALAQAQAKVSQAEVKVAQSEAAVRKGQANLEAFLSAEAANRGVSRAELESLLEDRQKRLAATNDVSSTQPSPSDDKARQSLITQIKTRDNYKYPQGK